MEQLTWLLILINTIGLRLKGSEGTNALAYFTVASATSEKSLEASTLASKINVDAKRRYGWGRHLVLIAPNFFSSSKSNKLECLSPTSFSIASLLFVTMSLTNSLIFVTKKGVLTSRAPCKI